MTDFTFVGLIAYMLAAFFVVGAVVNFILPAKMRDDYRRWGYPAGFNVVTGALELLAAILIVVPSTRLWGIALAAVVMLAAVATTLRHDGPKASTAPVVALVLTVCVGIAVYRSSI